MKGRHLLICVLIFTLLTAFAFAEESPVPPRVQFFITGYIGHLGRETRVIVQCSNPQAVDNRPQAIVKRVTGSDAVSGSIIQFHLNGYNTPEVLDEIIPRYQAEFGYRVVTLGELMALSGREVPELPDARPAGD